MALITCAPWESQDHCSDYRMNAGEKTAVWGGDLGEADR